MTTLIGISLRLLAVTIGFGVSLMVKIVPDDLPNTQLVFFRCLFAIPFVIGFAFMQANGNWVKVRQALTPNNIWLHIRRSSFGLMSMFLIFTAIKITPLPIVSALKELSPILITMLAALFLGKKIKLIRTTGLIFGVFGVALISYEAFLGSLAATLGTNAMIGALAALGSAFTIAIAQIQIRSMVGRESPASIVLFFFVLGTLVTIAFAPFTWQMPSAKGWLILCLLGTFGGIAQILLTVAYKYADVSTLAPFEYFGIPLAIIVGEVFFDEFPTTISMIGICFILAGGLIIIYREGQLARRERAQK